MGLIYEKAYFDYTEIINLAVQFLEGDEVGDEDAARVRDRIIAIRKRLAGEVPEDDQDVAMAMAAAPRARTGQVRNWRRSRRGP